ncbi:MAG: twin-arginine translocation signal domain-containing protein [Planctomycetota bacterium]
MSRRTKEAETISRRGFLKGSAVAAGTAIAWPRIVPSSVFGAAAAQKAAQTPDPITGAELAEGFGVNKGGLGGEEIIVTTFDELAKAIKRSNVYIKVKGDLIATGKATIGSGSNLTIDGGGAATLWGNRNPSQRMLELTGKNVVIKDIRLRNSGDNLSFKAPAEYVLVSHVTTSGAMDDGMSISYGTKNVTVQYCFFVGNTRSCFIKYGDVGNISMHHNWFKAQYMRGPLVSSAQFVDIRNQIGEDWATWGGPRFERGATGNCVNSVFVMTGAAPGKRDAADYTYQDGGPAYFHGSIYRGCSGRPGNSETEIPCAPVTTDTAEEAEKIVRAGAGCLPRDAIDKAYAEGTKWPRMGERRPWLINVGPGQPFVPTESVKKIDEKKVTKKEGTDE